MLSLRGRGSVHVQKRARASSMMHQTLNSHASICAFPRPCFLLRPGLRKGVALSMHRRVIFLTVVKMLEKLKNYTVSHLTYNQ